jgi:hypothetical protein
MSESYRMWQLGTTIAMAETNDQDANIKQALLEVAKQAIAKSCEIELSEVVVRKDDILDFSTEDSSAVIFFYPDTDPTSYVFRATLLYSVEETPEIYKFINEVNRNISLGQVYFEEGEIILYHRLVVEAAESEPIITILEYMQELADEYDDRLKSLVGGSRFLEREDDEVEV